MNTLDSTLAEFSRVAAAVPAPTAPAAPQKRHLSVSSAASYRRCQREYQLSRDWTPLSRSSALGYGLMMHAGLEVWFRTVDDEQALVAIESFARAGKVDDYDLAGCGVLMIGYHERWLSEPLEVLFVEKDFTSAMINPETGAASRTWELYGRLDAVVKDAFGRVFIVEHKTTSSDLDNPSYWQKLRLDAQISTYYQGVRALGVEPAGVIYDVIRKPSSKPYKATPIEKRAYTKMRDKACPECRKKKASPGPHRITISEPGNDDAERLVECENGRVVTDPGGRLYANMRDRDETVDEYRDRVAKDVTENPDGYFRRAIIERTDTDEREAAADTWQLAQAMRESVRLGRFPRNPDACVRFGDTCAFFPVCTREVTDMAGSGLYKLRVKDKKEVSQ